MQRNDHTPDLAPTALQTYAKIPPIPTPPHQRRETTPADSRTQTAGPDAQPLRYGETGPAQTADDQERQALSMRRRNLRLADHRLNRHPGQIHNRAYDRLLWLELVKAGHSMPTVRAVDWRPPGA